MAKNAIANYWLHFGYDGRFKEIVFQAFHIIALSRNELVLCKRQQEQCFFSVSFYLTFACIHSTVEGNMADKLISNYALLLNNY